jgi:hypothetical protein
MNTDVLLAAQGLLEAPERAMDHKARALLSKFLNSVNGSYSVSLVISATHLLGYGDSWFPFDTVPFDLNAHWHGLARDFDALDAGLNPDEDEDHEIINDRNASRLHVVAAKDAYRYRCDALSSWSPYEMAMAFNVVRSRAKTVQALALKDGYPGASAGHQPRDTMAIPRLYRDPCHKPDDSASREDKDTYAAFALGNFFPYDRMLDDLQGATLWEKYLSWVDKRPRGVRDDLALSMLHNLHIQCVAREQMREHSRTTLVRRMQLRQEQES